MPVVLTADQIRRTRRAIVLAAGNIAEAARLLGLARATVHERVLAYPETWPRDMTPARRPPRPFADDERAEAIALYESGLSFSQVAKRLGRPRGTVYAALRGAVTPHSTKGGRRKATAAQRGDPAP